MLSLDRRSHNNGVGIDASYDSMSANVGGFTCPLLSFKAGRHQQTIKPLSSRQGILVIYFEAKAKIAYGCREEAMVACQGADTARRRLTSGPHFDFRLRGPLWDIAYSAYLAKSAFRLGVWRCAPKEAIAYLPYRLWGSPVVPRPKEWAKSPQHSSHGSVFYLKPFLVLMITSVLSRVWCGFYSWTARDVTMA